MSTTRTVNDNRQRVLQVAKEIISRKGFSAVGLNEILSAAGIPKGSFYHYFSSKEAFGTAMLEDYFVHYCGDMDQRLSAHPCAVQAMTDYWENWLSVDTSGVPKGYQCLAVKLGAEVSDLSESMREVLDRGTTQVIQRLAAQLELMAEQGNFAMPPEGSIRFATALYQLWLGASLMGKISLTPDPLESALTLTKRLLQL